MSLGEFLTVADAAAELGVTAARLHQLIKTYGVRVERLSNGKFFLIHRGELKKIPKDRPTGVHVS